jgi:hypothetical protein
VSDATPRQSAAEQTHAEGLDRRAGQTWRFHRSIFLVLGTTPGYHDVTATLHLIVWLDYRDNSPSNMTGKLSEKFELIDSPWEGERYMERLA